MEVMALVASICAIVVSVVALTVNARSSSAAAKSADEAERSADASERSADAAETSAEVARQERDRAIERNDVHWDLERDPDLGVERFTNTGSDAAHNVEVVVYVAGDRREQLVGTVAGGESFTIETDSDWKAARESLSRTIAEMRAAGFTYLSSAKVPLTGRITWTSAHGTPGIQAIDSS